MWIYFKNPQIGVHIYNPILPKKVPIQRQIDWRYFQTVSYALLIQRQIDWRHLQTMLQELDIHFLIDIIYSRMQMHTQQLVRQFSRLLKTYRRHPQNFLKIMAHTFPMQKKILLKHFHIIFIMYMIAWYNDLQIVFMQMNILIIQFSIASYIFSQHSEQP